MTFCRLPANYGSYLKENLILGEGDLPADRWFQKDDLQWQTVLVTFIKTSKIRVKQKEDIFPKHKRSIRWSVEALISVFHALDQL